MKKVWIVTLSIIASVIMSLLFSFSPQTTSAVQEELQFESYYLVNNNTPYKSTQLAGYSSGGYGDLEINTSATIYANAADGYRLVGWYLAYIDRVQDDEPVKTQFITKSGETTETLGTQTITYNVKFDISQDGNHYDGSFSIDRVGENLNIIPIFDFEYYKLNVTNFFNLVDGLTFDDTHQVYYTKNEGNNYENAIVKEGNEYFYLGNAQLDGDTLFTSHNTMPEAGEVQTQLVDSSLGAWRVGERVNLSLKLKTKPFDDIFNDETGNKNINLLSASLDGDTASVGLSQVLDKTQSAEGITTAFELVFDFSLKQNEVEKIFEDADKQLTLNLQYCPIYMIEIVPYVDGKSLGELDADSEVRALILKQLQITPAYYSFDSEPVCKYLVKKAKDNSGLGARLVYPDTIYYQENETQSRYYYYQIANLPSTDFSDINQDTQIKVEFNSITYQVQFEFVLKTENGASLLNDMKVEPSISLTRGQSPADDIKQTEASNNIGYKFLGFTTNLSNLPAEDDANKTLSKDLVKIDKTRPTNLVVYMVYEYEKYTIKLTGLDLASFKEQNSYPFSSITLTTQSGQWQATDLANKSEYTFENNFVVVDNLNFTFRLNSGFVAKSFAVGSLSVDASAGSATFSMKSILQEQSSLVDNQIEIKVVCDYETYTLDYTLNATLDADKNKNVFMGDISLTLSRDLTGQEDVTILLGEDKEQPEPKDYGRIKVSTTKDGSVLNFHVEGLRMYDKLTLNAIAKIREQETYYQFNRFLESSINTLPVEKTVTEHTYSTNYSIFKNANVVVTFVVPTTLFEVVSDLNAIDFADVSVEANNKQLSLDATGQIEKIDTGEITVRFNTYSYGGKGVKFGYKFVSATFTAGEQDATISTQNGEQQIEIKLTLSSEPKYTLHLHFEEVAYKLEIVQKNADESDNQSWQNQKVRFGEQEFKTIKVSDLAVSFEAPVGYYAGRFYKGDWSIDLAHDGTTNLIDYTFDIYQLENLVHMFDVNANNSVEINVEYLIRKYSLTVQFVVSSDRAQYDDIVLASLPNLTLDGLNLASTRRDNSLVFKDIPYNTHLVVKVDGGIRVGLKKVGWFNQNGEALAQQNLDGGNLVFDIINDATYTYRLQYEEFTILLTKQENAGLELNLAGDPVSLVNNEVGKQIKLFDNLTINANANRANGYTLDYIYYYTFVKYTLNDWQADKQNLYYLLDGNYVKVDFDDYNSQYQYFTLQEVNVKDGSPLKEFDMSNMLLTRKEDKVYIEFFVVYKELDITLEHIIVYEGKSNDQLNQYKGSFGYIDTPTYRFMRYQKDTGDWEEDLNPTQSPLHYRDIVHVYTNFKTIDGAPFGIDGEINLKLGIKLTIYVGGQTILFTPSDECDNYFWFNINSVLSTLPEETNTLTIKYQFEIQNKLLQFNCGTPDSKDITDTEFYTNGDKENEEKYFILTVSTFEGEQTLPYSEQESGTDTLKFDTTNIFLTQATLRYEAKNFVKDGRTYNYGNFLIIADVKVYVQNEQGGWDEVLDREETKNLGITINRSVQGQVTTINYYYLSNVKLQLIVQPIIENFNSTSVAGKALYEYSAITTDKDLDTPFTRTHEFAGDYLFNLDVANKNKIVGLSQTGLTIGASSSYNIQLSEYLAMYTQVEAEYYYGNQIIPLSDLVNVGSYKVNLKFSDLAPSWLKEIGFGQYNIVMVINKVKLDLIYQGEVYSKPYEGQNKDQINPNILESKILPNLVFRANDCLVNIRFGDNNIPIGAERRNIEIPMRKDDVDNANFKFDSRTKPIGRVTTTINDQEVGVYEVGNNYNLTLEKLFLVGLDNSPITNFELNIENNTKTFNNCASITQKEVYLENLRFRDKIYDGTDTAIIDNRYNVSVSGLGEDAAYLEILAPQAIFVTDDNQVGKDVGADKRIQIINLDAILVGRLARNYKLILRPDNNYKASIYPYKISAKVEGYGTITLVNVLGKTDYSKVGLIPINANLSVELVRAETGAYNRIYRYIASYLKSKSYGIGYRLHLTENGVEKQISNQLFLQLPSINKLFGVVHLSGNNIASQLNYDVDSGIVIDLRQLDSPNLFIVIKNRPLFTWWQILLIVLLSLLVVAVIVVIVLVRRKKKLDKYKQQDKI